MTTKAIIKRLLSIRDFKVGIAKEIKQFGPDQQYVLDIEKDIPALETAARVLKERDKA